VDYGKMIIKKLKIENIRSYVNQDLTFPEGSILLSGDVGAGKSTVLLSIEFALFGISKGYLSGGSLLRNGKDKGSVTLEFSVNNKDVTIKRTLKRSANSVTQDYGYITINGKTQEMSAVELKQAVLDLLNYPPESLTKSKSLVYRYTVYTPQEEMKHILLSDKDTRLDILRKVFGIDKYKLIKDNTKITLSFIKDKRKELEYSISNLSEKETEKYNLKNTHLHIGTELDKLKPLLENSSDLLVKEQNKLKDLELITKKVNALKNELSITEANIRNKQYEFKRNSDELIELSKNIEKIEAPQIDLESLKENISKKEQDINLLEQAIKSLTYNISIHDVQIKNSEKVKSDILSLKKCPVCQQDVNESHKEHITESENKKIEDSIKTKEALLMKDKEQRFILESLKKECSNLEKQKYDFQLIQLKIKNNLEKEQKISRNSSYLEELKKLINEMENKKLAIINQLSEFKDTEEENTHLNRNLDRLRKENTNLHIEKSRLDTRLNEINNQILLLEKEIEKKLVIKQKVITLSTIQQWLDSNFINLIDNIERHTMVKINSDFNELFERWFKMIIETENLNIKLDDNFSPIIDQNGFEIDYENLSGGEKTAGALAYRLALNQVINSLVTTINTKDLIILDEPTDGFSDDQLDRIRLILNELNTKQTILVSHESKIESFVDNIIRFNKNNHITEII
jgi:DNA repair protein SbcC/Rad50